jgi:hypothetical protein
VSFRVNVKAPPAAPQTPSDEAPQAIPVAQKRAATVATPELTYPQQPQETETASSRNSANARSALACLGASLLVLGLFFPMLTAPAGITVSFFDYSTKAAWGMSKIALKVLDASAEPSRESKEDTPNAVVRAGNDYAAQSKPSDTVKLIALSVGIVLTLVSPISPVALLVVGVYVLWSTIRSLTQGGASHKRMRTSALSILNFRVQ